MSKSIIAPVDRQEGLDRGSTRRRASRIAFLAHLSHARTIAAFIELDRQAPRDFNQSFVGRTLQARHFEWRVTWNME